MMAPYDDLIPLKDVLKDVRIVLLGEQSHWDGATLLAKNRLIRFLHEEEGFNVLAFECGTFECQRADEMLRPGADVRPAMAACLHQVWNVNEVVPLFEYVAWTKGTQRPLRLTGFDSQPTGDASREKMQSLLAFVGDIAQWSETERLALLRLNDVSSGTYRPTEDPDKGIRAALDRLREAFDGARPILTQRHGEAMTEFYSRVIDNLRAYERQIYLYSMAKRNSDANAAVRDRQMGENIRWLAETYCPDERIICWAATAHCMHGVETIKTSGRQLFAGFQNMGEVVRLHFGNQAYVVGFAAHHGTMGNPFREVAPVPSPPVGSVEDILHRYGAPLSFTNLRVPGPLSAQLSSSCIGYYVREADWTKVLDGIFFTDEMTPSTKIQ